MVRNSKILEPQERGDQQAVGNRTDYNNGLSNRNRERSEASAVVSLVWDINCSALGSDPEDLYIEWQKTAPFGSTKHSSEVLQLVAK